MQSLTFATTASTTQDYRAGQEQMHVCDNTLQPQVKGPTQVAKYQKDQGKFPTALNTPSKRLPTWFQMQQPPRLKRTKAGKVKPHPATTCSAVLYVCKPKPTLWFILRECSLAGLSGDGDACAC